MLNVYSLILNFYFSILIPSLAGYVTYNVSYRAVVRFDLHRPVRIFFLLDERGAAIINSESIEKVDPSRLKPHPVNQEVYREEEVPESFVDSVEKKGVRVPVKAKKDGTIISGHRRWLAAKELGINVPVLRVSYENELEEELAVIEHNRQREKTFSQKMREGEKLEEIEREKARNRMSEGGKGGLDRKGSQKSDDLSKGRTDEKVASKAGLGSRDTYRKGKKIWEKAKKGNETAQKQVERLDKDKTSISNAYRQVKREERKTEIEEKSAKLPEDKFRVIYADPPWPYDNSGLKGSAEDHYPTMPVDEICSLPIEEKTDNDAVLFLWTTSPFLEEGPKICRAWGFDYKTSFVWIKDRSTYGKLGFYTHSQHEFLLVATKGSCLPKEGTLVPSIISAPKGEHSEKPEKVYEIIEQMYDGPYLELFARQKRKGWTAWGPGNQIGEEAIAEC